MSIRNTSVLQLSLVLILTATLTGACSSAQHREEKRLDAQVKAEPSAEGPGAIASRGAQMFVQAPGLTEEQKRRLLEIHTRVYTQNAEIRTEIGKAKSLLFRTLVSNTDEPNTIAGLKKKIASLDQRRLNLMFQALDEVQQVVGRGPDKEPIYRRFYEFDIDRGE
ncbi:MAG: hypothetical protein NDI61_11670, partial [Bdellovibrionaceae bacterium]|nr:hypothetical protein [Pseudobdellovibrionaceae bacterium]